jgi:NAD(P)-dependent dehydrogenase (short-subunit alcohol dehydrogenase family)
MSIDPQHLLAGSHALVTGGSSGIGAVVAHHLVAAGARGTVLGRPKDVREALVATHPEQLHAVVADVADAGQVTAVFASAHRRFDPLHILINNAGQATSAPLLKTDEALWQQMLAINLTGTFLCSRAALTYIQCAAGKSCHDT